MSGSGVALGTGVGLGVAVGVEEGVAERVGAEGPVTGLVEGDASWLEVQPPIKPTIPNTTTTVESFMSFIALFAPVHGWRVRQAGRQTRAEVVA